MNSHKPFKLKKNQIKHGVLVSESLNIDEVARRKVKSDAFKKVQYGRKAIIVTEYGKKLAIILPLAENN
jgi:hypothetical protein